MTDTADAGPGPGALVHHLLDDAARRWPAAPAVSDGTDRLTWAQLAEHSERAAGWLRRRGVRPGDRVVLRLPGDALFAALLYGTLRLGAAAVPLNPALSPYQLGWILTDAAPALVLAGTGDLEATRRLTPAPVTATSLAELAAEPPGPAAAGPEPSGTALLIYTSGSTAMPRAVVCPHDRVRFVVGAIAARLRYTAADVVFNRAPLSFDYGLHQLFLCARAGAALELRPRLSDARLLAEVRDCGATVLPVMPALAEILHRLAGRDPRPTAVRLITSTGAALLDRHAAGLRAAFPGAAIVPMYGMTECKRITVAEPDEDLRHPGTAGRALDGTTVTVADEHGRPVPPGVTGEILVRGPHVMAGYWDGPGRPPRSFGAQLRTGDHGHLDEQGRLYVSGRRDDLFKRRGVRTGVQEIEAAALDVPGVRAAAVRRPDDDGDLVVWVTGEVTPEDVLTGILARLERAKLPDRCVVLPALPTTPNGKVDKAALVLGQPAR